MLTTIAKILRLGNASMGALGVLTIAAPFLAQSDNTLCVSYPVVGVALIFAALWSQAALRTPTN